MRLPLGRAGALQGALVPTGPPPIFKEQHRHRVKANTQSHRQRCTLLWHTRVVWSEASYLACL